MDISKLNFVRLTQPGQFDLIPPKLLEQIKGYEPEDIERLKNFGRMVIANPLAFIYVLISEDSKIHGILWFELCVTSAVFHVKLLSLDDEYQNKKGARSTDPDKNIMIRAIQFITEQRKDVEKRYGFVTKPVITAESSRPRYCEKFLNAVRSKSVSIEMPIGEDHGK